MSEPAPSTSTPPGEDEAPAPRRRAWVPGVILIVLGGIWLAHQLGATIVWAAILAGALVIVGIATLVGGRRAEHRGLVVLGTWLAIAALLVTFAPWPSGLGVGQREHTITAMSQLQDRYGLLAGQMELDLRELDLPAGTTRVTIDVVLGQAIVLVPDGVTVRGGGRALAGEVDGPGDVAQGLLPRATFDEPAPQTDAPTLELALRVGLGQIEVTR